MSDLRIASVSMAPIAATATARVPGPTSSGGFGESLSRSLEAVNSLQLQAQAAASSLAGGQPVDMAQTLVTVEKANISLQFALQIRNKLVEAYQEIMRLQV